MNDQKDACIEFIATLGKSKIDEEGESTIELKIPLQYRDQAFQMISMNDTLIKVVLTKETRAIYEL